MARYKDYSYTQGKFIPIFFEKQIVPGTDPSGGKEFIGDRWNNVHLTLASKRRFNIDGFVKSPSAALHCIPCPVKIDDQDLRALHLELFTSP